MLAGAPQIPVGFARLVAALGAVCMLWIAGCTDETCSSSEDCPTGERCELGRCGPAPMTEPDAGPRDDAGPDGDATPRDAADAQPPDTGLGMDSGAPDGGMSADVGPDGGLDAGQAIDGGFEPPDAGFLAVRLQFPPGGRVVTSTSAITVRGELNVPGTVSAVTVNGVIAASADAFAHFAAEVPLVSGDNPLEVRYVEDGVEHVDNAGLVARQDVLLLSPTDIESSGGQLFVLDDALDRLVSIDVVSGAARIVTGGGVGSGPSFVGPDGLVLTATQAYVLDRSRDAVMTVDLVTGARAIFSREGAGAGPAFVDPRGIGFDEAAGRLFVVDSNLDALFSVDVRTGARAVVSDDTTGTGPTFTTPRAVRWDAPRGRVLVADTGRDTIFTVDPVTGDRSLFSGPGPSLPEPSGLALTADGAGLWVADLGSDTLLRVDLQTGDRTLVASRTRGVGPWFEPRAVTELGGEVYVLDNARDGLVRVAPGTGDRVSAYANVTFEGAHPSTPWGVTVHPQDPRAPMLVSDNSFGRILAIDLQTGLRTVLLSGAEVAAPFGMAYDAPGRRALFVDTSLDALMSVDVYDGTARFVSDEVVAGGPLFSAPRDVARSASGALFVVDDAIDTIFGVAPSGARTVIGSDTTGSGVELDQPYAVAVVTSSSGAPRLFVADSGTDVVMVVDPATGVRTPLPGADQDLSTPRGLAVSQDQATLYVTDQTRRLVLAIDLATDTRTTLASAQVGRGVPLSSPVGVDVHPDGYLVVVDNSDAVIGIDLMTLERVYLTK